MITYYVVQSFQVGRKGILIPDEPREVPTARGAVAVAERLASERAGAFAFAKSGDPSTGEYEDAVLLCTFGLVPAEALEAAA